MSRVGAGEVHFRDVLKDQRAVVSAVCRGADIGAWKVVVGGVGVHK